MSCCRILLPCPVAVSCCRVLLTYPVAVSCCRVLLLCPVDVSCCRVLFTCQPVHVFRVSFSECSADTDSGENSIPVQDAGFDPDRCLFCTVENGQTLVHSQGGKGYGLGTTGIKSGQPAETPCRSGQVRRAGQLNGQGRGGGRGSTAHGSIQAG